MRIATNTVYKKTNTNLGKLTTGSMKATEVVSSGKRINHIQDDPVGISQTMNLNSSLSNIEQLQRNISIGKTWLNGSETSLDSIKEILADAKVLCIAIKNGSLNESDRNGAAEQVSEYIWQIEELANTKVNGDYVFSGSKTSTRPFSFDNQKRPQKAIYKGDDKPFAIKNGARSSIQVGHSGRKLFTRDLITVDTTNNKIDFIESTAPGVFGPELTAEIPIGNYTPKELAAKMESALESRSKHTGRSEIVKVNHADALITVNNYDGLKVGTPRPHGTEPFTLDFDGKEWNIGSEYYPIPRILYHRSNDSKIEIDFTEDGVSDVDIRFGRPMKKGDSVQFEINIAKENENSGNAINYDIKFNEHSKTFSILEDKAAPILDDLQILWKTGTHTDTSIGPDIGFDLVDIKRNVMSDIPVRWPISISTGLAPMEDELAINEILEPETYTDDFELSETDLLMYEYADDSYVEGAVDKDGNVIQKNDEIIFTEDDGRGHTIPLIAKLTPNIEYNNTVMGHQELALDIQNKMREVSYENGYGIDYQVFYDEEKDRFVFESDDKSKLKEFKIDWFSSTSAEILGFEKETDICRKPIGKNNVEWGVFNTLIALRKYLKTDDPEGVDRSITRLESDHEHLLSEISRIGNNEMRLDIKNNIIEDLNVSYNTNKSNIEDADAFEAISNFQAKENAYKSALAASSKVLKVSLMDYI